MPAIHSTELSAWRVVARRWRRGNRGREASQLPREERLASLAARGAYIEAQWNSVYRAPDLQADWCRACAQWTTSWCEGCYARCQPGDEFSAICHACDGEHRVCDRCEARAVTWQQGHQRYVEENGEDQESQVQIHGFGTQTEAPFFREASESISLSELGSALNMPTDRIREYIIAQLRSHEAGSAHGGTTPGTPGRSAHCPPESPRGPGRPDL